MWPEIGKLVQKRISESEKSVLVLDAAVLLEANWQSMVHEVWVAIVPPNEAVRRIVERNHLTQEQVNLPGPIIKVHDVYSQLLLYRTRL